MPDTAGETRMGMFWRNKDETLSVKQEWVTGREARMDHCWRNKYETLLRK